MKMDPFMTGSFHESAIFFSGSFQPESMMTKDGFAMRRQTFPYINNEASSKLFPTMRDGDIFGGASNFAALQGFQQQQSLISAFRPQPREEPMDDIGFPSGDWTGPSKKMMTDEPPIQKHVDDDQFLAYIDEVLGPIDPAPV